MNIVLLKNRGDSPSIVVQQKQILKYVHHHGIKVDTTEIENSNPEDILEERKEFKGFLRSLEDGSCLIIFDLFTLSKRVDELVKVFECLMRRSISIHLTNTHTVIDVHSQPLMVLEILAKQRELSKNIEKEKLQGRPKGRMSKSKFDIHRSRIIELLEHHISVSEIAQILNVSRTSLKDYINSRGLKDLVKAKMTLLNPIKKQTFIPKPAPVEECSLIQIEGMAP